MKYLDIDYLKKHHTKIHAFGLGFIQIKLGEIERLHIYHKDVLLTTEEEVHNHRYNFTSKVLKGKLTNIIFEVKESPNGEFLIVDESCNPNKKAKKNEKSVLLPTELVRYESIKGSEYSINKDTFHRVLAETGTITLLSRGKIEKESAQIVFKKGEIPKCPFSANLDEETLWKMVKESL